MARGFRSVPLDEGAPIGAASRVRPARDRLRQDQSRLGFDLDQLTRDWERWLKGSISAPSFPTYAFGIAPSDEASPCRETAYRWARAVTNRRVGMALSGGGACAYRALPLIQMLRRRGVPIDLFSGASGGSLIGAYYCAEGLAGLRHARRRGPAFLLASIGSTLWSGVMELQVDRDLGCRRVEDLEVIFLPVTTALGDPPAASVVVGGTLGEAVRASGSALFAFGPTRKGALRYADGSTATMIPAKVLSDHGADLVLACNCRPGPRYGNPLGGYMIGRIAYSTPIIGRIIDTWVASSYLLTTASRMAGTDAQVYGEPSPVWDPLFEAPHFERANDIVAESLETDGRAMRAVTKRMYELWTGLGR
jgi:NTE family protein